MGLAAPQPRRGAASGSSREIGNPDALVTLSSPWYPNRLERTSAPDRNLDPDGRSFFLPPLPAGRPDGLGRPHHPYCDGGGAGDRQSDLHLDPVQQAARRASLAGAAHRHLAGAGHAPGAAVDHRLDRDPDRAGVQRVRQRLLVARHDPDRGRPVPGLEGHQGNPPHGRSRGRRRPAGEGQGRRGHQQPRRGDLPDHPAGPGVLDRLHPDRRGHDRTPADHGHRRAGGDRA